MVNQFLSYTHHITNIHMASYKSLLLRVVYLIQYSCFQLVTCNKKMRSCPQQINERPDDLVTAIPLNLPYSIGLSPN